MTWFCSFLDGGRDGLHLGRAFLGKRREEHGVLDGHRGVEVCVQGIFRDIELATQLEIDFDGAAVCDIGGGAVFLVVVGFGHGRAPVHHQAFVVFVRHAGVAYIEFFRSVSRLVLQTELREVRLLEQQARFLEVLEVELLRGVVQVDVFIGGGVFRVGLEGLAHAGEVACEFVGEHLLVGGHFGIELLDLRREGSGHFHERFVGSAQMLLFLREDGVFFSIEFARGVACGIEPGLPLRVFVGAVCGKAGLRRVGEHGSSLAGGANCLFDGASCLVGTRPAD